MSTTLKIFLISSIPFALFMGTYYSLCCDLRTGIMAGLTGGIAVGIILAAIVGGLHRRCVNKISGHHSDENREMKTSREIELKMPLDRAFDLCVASLGSINRSHITEENRSQGNIMAKTGINWKTWGETIGFTLRRLDDETTHVMVSSRPTAQTTLVDFGKNLENVQSIISFLKRNRFTVSPFQRST